ncbi:MAG: STAS domain-containing protein [Betaproteobacteria bacterium]|nr:STAS domain-containing protein [Betaproteobacteria bacterium]
MTIENRDGRYWVAGPVTIRNATALRDEGLRQFQQRGGGAIEVDLSAVTEVDSSALSILFEWARVLSRQGGTVRFHNLTQNMRSLASVYEVLDLLPSA